ncbi:MAG: hypothetical protein Ct9H300mP18_13700 [Candidatus Neomarinimicrobiota bacterium]|nr:MAG: hypothetical protein Ct9H300mP18_13700 [Candidatus Neomarinimicrobiota bacterium]
MERVVGTLVRPFFNDQEQSDIENSELDLKTGLNQRLDKITFLNEKISEYLLITSRGISILTSQKKYSPRIHS